MKSPCHPAVFWVCGGFTLAGLQVPTNAALSLLIWKGGRKYNKGFLGQNKGREKSLTNYHNRQNRPSLGKFIYYQSNQILKHLPSTPPFFPGLNALLFLSASSPPAAQRLGNGGWGQIITCHSVVPPCKAKGSKRIPHTLPCSSLHGATGPASSRVGSSLHGSWQLQHGLPMASLAWAPPGLQLMSAPRGTQERPS